MTTFDLDLSKYQLGWSDEVEYAFTPEKGLNQGVVETAKLNVPRPWFHAGSMTSRAAHVGAVTKPETDSFCKIAGSATGSVTSTASISFAADLASNFTVAPPVEVARARKRTTVGVSRAADTSC